MYTCPSTQTILAHSSKGSSEKEVFIQIHTKINVKTIKEYVENMYVCIMGKILCL